MKNSKRGDWLLRVVKGMFIGSGFILPGVSGGALAAVFGIYERMIGFLANLKKDFKENVAFFIPVALGMAAGVFVLAFPINYLLVNAKTYTFWFFIGCILGTLPALFRQAGKKGWKYWHLGLMVIVCAGAYWLLTNMKAAGVISFSDTFLTWILAGVIIGLGVILPGLSPSNLLMYMTLNGGDNLYNGMAAGIKHLDFGVIIPLLIGVAACVLLFSKLMNYILDRAYPVMYHAIIGFVIASTLIIVPTDVTYFQGILPTAVAWISLVTCAAGVALALFMSKLEAKYKPGD